jgi:hypothetical protein
MALFVFAVLFMLWFSRGIVHRIGAAEAVGGAAKSSAVFLIVLWCLIMMCGRWIAYAPV